MAGVTSVGLCFLSWSGIQPFPVHTDGHWPHLWIQFWLKTLQEWSGLHQLVSSQVERRPNDDDDDDDDNDNNDNGDSC